MKKNFILFLAILIAAVAIDAHGLSLGVYADGAAGRMFLADATWGREVHDNFSPGCGILMNTPLAGAKDAGYRLGFGFDRVFIPRTTMFASDYDDVYRLNLNNMLTYSFYNRNGVSLWVGPQIAFSVVSGRIHSAGNKRLRDLVFLPGIPRDEMVLILLGDALNRRRSFTDFTLGLAPVLGIDYLVNEYVVISADAGFRGGIHLKANNPGSMFRYEGFGEFAVMLRIVKESVPEEN
jgi:hypothetical protein